ncbi:MAG: hypothetical protein II937_09550 [Bacteroidales bacterium]|nr:hypothetical protein [Bacteroidales bacterium]
MIIQQTITDEFFAIATYGDNPDRFGRNLIFLDENGYQYGDPKPIDVNRIKILNKLRKSCYPNWEIFTVKVQQMYKVSKN